MNENTKLKDAFKDHEGVHFGRMLKYWRSVYKVSQEELAFRIDSASRHIGRLENGGAQPSKEMVIRIAKAIPLSQRDTINLLFSAGYTDLSGHLDISHSNFKHRKEEVILGLKVLDPNPAVVIDMTGHLLMVNRAWAGFQKQLDPKGELSGVSNIFDFFLGYAELHSPTQDWEGTFSVAMLWLQQSLSLYGNNNSKIAALLKRFEASPYLPDNWQRRAAARKGGQVFRMNVMFNEKMQSFLLHTYIENLFGPLAFSAVPDMFVMTFCAEDESLDLSSLLKPRIEHPLLFY
ncbi:helix-turn-helix domain-containing protein [Thalassotalea sp. ND16A]|uniref:helix-turn-helix domain-containing protein n=1 Tax=Thalassotalea sp. ND16A TaxID=1535422 RepID=UPI00051A1BCB|nr:helix-turn-helix transcriptional regulator [Thalassotalea sp. ND16A]KGJ87863.1 hypothetical protein ND16A_2777 [Thalassotalea sp. ND16A]